jgi:REP element-mobilizing transposase RayT
MPNHVHGIVWLGRQGVVAAAEHRQAQRSPVSSLSPLPGQSGSWMPFDGKGVARPQQKGDLLGVKIARFKSLATKRLRCILGTLDPIWQDDYYDRIVRDERELEAIGEYILDNPRKWELDPLNPNSA